MGRTQALLEASEICTSLLAGEQTALSTGYEQDMPRCHLSVGCLPQHGLHSLSMGSGLRHATEVGKSFMGAEVGSVINALTIDLGPSRFRTKSVPSRADLLLAGYRWMACVLHGILRIEI